MFELWIKPEQVIHHEFSSKILNIAKTFIFFIRCKHCPLKGTVMPTISEADYGDEEDDDEEMIQ